MNNQGFGLCPLLQNEVTKRTLDKTENTERYVKLYEAMKQAIPDDNTQTGGGGTTGGELEG